MTFLQYSLRMLVFPAVLLLCLLGTADLAAQNSVTFSLQNRQTNAGVYYAELWADINPGDTWQPGNCLITIRFNRAALAIGDFNNAELVDPDAALNGGGYMPMYQSLYSNLLAVNIINLSGSFATKSSSFRIGTIRWEILNGFLQDSLSFETAGDDASILGNGWEVMEYNCGNNTCYGITNPTPAQTGNPPVITQQPESAIVCAGSPVSMSVTATSALAYQWEYLNGQTWQPLAGVTSATLAFASPSTAQDGSYRVILTGNAPPVATSQTITLDIMTPIHVFRIPQPTTVCEGATAEFTAVFNTQWFPQAEPTIMAWEVLPAGQSVWSAIPNANDTTLTLPTVSASMSGNKYRLRGTNRCSDVLTDEVTLTVWGTPVITTQSTVVTATAGDNTSLSATATGEGLVYRWQKNNTDIPGATTATLALANVQTSDIGLYRAIVTGSCGTADTSDQMILIVQTVDTTKTTLVVKALMQGYWDGANHVRTPVSVELRTGALPLTSVLASIQTGILQQNGTVTLEFNDIQSGNYWLIVRHGGYLPVASASAVSVTRGSTTQYDFSDAASKAYQGGTIPVVAGGQTYYVLKGGDLNGNRSVNPQDLPLLLIGYPKTNASSIPGL